MLSRREAIRVTMAALTLPALPMTMANAISPPSPVKEPCPEFPWFGAHYPDARCIDGYLWDLDAYEDGMLTSGGEDPCPYCNAAQFLRWNKDAVEEAGWIAFTDGESPADNPYLKGSRFPHMTVALAEFWRDGYRAASVDPIAIEDRQDARAVAPTPSGITAPETRDASNGDNHA